ncbi:ankyrin repeat domain-containing protein [Tenacibaculum sp. 190524A02b]|uniref:Ankyrin repeat-containing protein n=1 Tax=Tenacibaculum vairaonense TaxID=3137860 RepID=A0ABM9PQR8_9FLAO
MKKFLVTTLVLVLSFSTMNATNSIEDNKTTTTKYFRLSTFCKMIQSGDYEAVAAFVKNGTDINRKSMGLTPVMYAARYNRTKILKLLIDKGARLKTKSDKGHTALDYAKMSKATESYDLLKAALEK